MTIAEQINAVVEARGKAKEMAEKKKALYDDFISKHTEFFTDVVVAATEASGAEDKLREMAIGEYRKTLDKAVAPGVGIRVMTKLDYDAEAALIWAMHHELALKLDTTKFEKIAKTENLPFVITTEEPTATIATELEKIN